MVVAEVTLTRRTQSYRGALLVCDCGILYETAIYDLLRDRYPTRSCGCLYRDKKSQGMSHAHELYGTWSNMMSRCYNPNVRGYRDYGARGITVCDRWHSARLFIEDIQGLLGPRPPGMTLDREDNDGNYEPGNVRWATRTTQARNKRQVADGTRSGPAYQLWWRLMRRCPGEVCPAWQDWPVFRDDIARLLGERPAGLRFDRIDDRLPYGPGNIAWVTGAAQAERARKARLSGPYPVKHGLWQHPLYETWAKLMRVHRGLLHEPWQDAAVFTRDIGSLLGERPARTVFRRIDPDGRYEPGNVCWGKAGRPPRS